MARYHVEAIAMSGAFQSFIEEVTDQHLVNVESRVVDHEVEAVEHWDITTTMDVSRSLDLSEGVVRWSERCEICGGDLTFALDDEWLETDTGSVCAQCQADAE